MGNSKSALVGGDDAQSLEALLGRLTALSPALFALTPTAHHGVPSSARTLAFCSRQGLLALGTASGAVKLIGRDELEVLLPGEGVNAGVALLQFTARQRLVVAYTDSSVRVFDLAAPNEALAELHGRCVCVRLCVCVDKETTRQSSVCVCLWVKWLASSWTTSTITCVETIRYQNFPFVFIGTDDGDIHVRKIRFYHTETIISIDGDLVSNDRFAINCRDVLGIARRLGAAEHIRDLRP